MPSVAGIQSSCHSTCIGVHGRTGPMIPTGVGNVPASTGGGAAGSASHAARAAASGDGWAGVAAARSGALDGSSATVSTSSGHASAGAASAASCASVPPGRISAMSGALVPAAPAHVTVVPLIRHCSVSSGPKRVSPPWLKARPAPLRTSAGSVGENTRGVLRPALTREPTSSGPSGPSAGVTPVAVVVLATTASASPFPEPLPAAGGVVPVASGVAVASLPSGGTGTLGSQIVSDVSALGAATNRAVCSTVSIIAGPSGWASWLSIPAMVACMSSWPASSSGFPSIVTPKVAAASAIVSAIATPMADGSGGPPASVPRLPPSPGQCGPGQPRPTAAP